MRPEALVKVAAGLLDKIFYGQQPADRLLNDHFRNQHLGRNERALLGDLVYEVLRHRLRFAAMFAALEAARPPTTMEVAACALACKKSWSPSQLSEFLGFSGLIIHDEFIPHPQLAANQQVSMPEWLWQEFSGQWGEATALQIAAALNEQPTVNLRVNSLKCNREQLLATLRAEGVEARATPYSKVGVRLDKRYSLQNLDSYNRGEFEVQDEGSQLIAQLLQPRSGDCIIDLCAGGGGKSLHLAALMGDRGRLLACDIDSKRLNRIKIRQRRAGVRVITLLPIRHEGDPKLRRWSGLADGVLVDAPCSGTGTLRRNPEIKWRLTPERVAVYQQRQGSLLDAGARLVKKGGRLVYATCSLLARENQEIVAAFLAQNRSFKTLDATYTVEGLPGEGPFLTLLPHITKTDGFFAAVFQRTH